MALVAFDTLAYSNMLERHGFPREQAEAIARANAEALRDIVATQELVTRKDLEIVRADLERAILATNAEIAATRADLEKSIERTRADLEKTIITTKADLEKRMEEGKHEMLKWLIGLMFAQAAVFAGLIAYLKY